MIQEFVRAFQPFEVVINTLPAVDQAVDTSVVDRVVDTFVVADQVVDTVNLQLMEFTHRLTTYYLYL